MHSATTPPGRVTPRHLARAGVGVTHEGDDERGQRDVECVVVERERLRDADAHVRARVARPAGVGELLRGIDGRHVVGPEPSGELAREAAGSAADVERAHPRLHPGRVGERDGERRDVAAHEAVVVLGGRGELHRRWKEISPGTPRQGTVGSCARARRSC